VTKEVSYTEAVEWQCGTYPINRWAS
jgi:hypothetical protein